MKLPEKPAFLINSLMHAGYDAYVVGGCVRDALLGVPPSDWDICTSASPQEIKQVFSAYKTLEIGMKHGTVAVILENQPYEITTFRRDGSYHDNRRPDSVQFVPKVEEDLLRRDFTVNAMAYNEQNGLVDISGGRADLEKGLLRTVGEADVRFGEDALRIIRCLRFAATYGFHIVEATETSIFKNRQLLGHIAVERLNSEFSKLLCGKAAGAVLRDYKAALAVFLTELLEAGEQEYDNRVALAEKAPAIISVRLAAFFSFLPEDKLSIILRRMKYSNQILEDAVAYRRFTHPLPENRTALKFLLSKIGFAAFDKMLLLKEISGEDVSLARTEAQQVRQNRECISIYDLTVNGHDLMELGYCGREIGQALNRMLEKVMSGRVENSRQALLNSLNETGNKFH